VADGIYSALSGAVAQERSLDIVANNVANSGTTGYRADRVAFEESLTRAQQTSQTPNSLRYVELAEVRFDDSQGALRETGNQLDCAIQGEGYFAVETPNGERYTRDGSFVTDAEGTLRTHDGHAVMGGEPGQPPTRITIPDGTAAVQIDRTGEIRADGVSVGRLRISAFDPQTLQKEGHTLFVASGAPRAAEGAEIEQGYLESANLNAVAGLNELISASRSFEAFQRVIQGFRSIDERSARDLGK
jgi:flagellar basal-body rod protein FlgF